MTCSGLYTALITPFKENGSLDEEGFRSNIARQMEAGVDGLVVLASTGEAATLTHKEKERLIKLSSDGASCEVMVGCSGNATSETIDNLKRARDFGATSALVSAPYYNKPTQEGIFRHFEALTQAISLPILVYNIPGRTAVHIELDTLKRIAALPNIFGIKEASGNISHIGSVISNLKASYPSFRVFSGDDILTLPIMALGGDGVICFLSNLLPEKMKALVSACLKNDFQKGRQLHFDLLPLFHATTLETNPIPIKAAMQACGLPAGLPRLPLTPLAEPFRSILLKVLQEKGVMKEKPDG